MQPNYPFVIQQLVYQGPMLVVYLVGIIVALMYLQRCRLPAILALCAIGTLVVTSIASAVVTHYLINVQSPTGTLGTSLMIVGILGSFIRAAAFGLLLAAIFIQRGKADETLRPPQFGLRALLIVMTVFCLIAGTASAAVWWLS
jgi:hypothetical protein